MAYRLKEESEFRTTSFLKGAEAVEIYEGFPFEKGENTDTDTVLHKFEEFVWNRHK